MIESTVVQALPKDWQDQVMVALATLHGSGVIQAQIKLLQERLVLGNDEEPVKELAKQILKLRSKISGLAELEELCTKYYKDMNHA